VGSTDAPLNGTPGHPVLNSTSHPDASSNEDTPLQDLSLSRVPATGISLGERRGSIPRQDSSQDSSYIPTQLTQPSPHTQDTRQDLPNFQNRQSMPYPTQQLSTKHHITDIMQSRVLVVRCKLLS